MLKSYKEDWPLPYILHTCLIFSIPVAAMKSGSWNGCFSIPRFPWKHRYRQNQKNYISMISSFNKQYSDLNFTFPATLCDVYANYWWRLGSLTGCLTKHQFVHQFHVISPYTWKIAGLVHWLDNYLTNSYHAFLCHIFTTQMNTEE